MVLIKPAGIFINGCWLLPPASRTHKFILLFSDNLFAITEPDDPDPTII